MCKKYDIQIKSRRKNKFISSHLNFPYKRKNNKFVYPLEKISRIDKKILMSFNFYLKIAKFDFTKNVNDKIFKVTRDEENFGNNNINNNNKNNIIILKENGCVNNNETFNKNNFEFLNNNETFNKNDVDFVNNTQIFNKNNFDSVNNTDIYFTNWYRNEYSSLNKNLTSSNNSVKYIKNNSLNLNFNNNIINFNYNFNNATLGNFENNNNINLNKSFKSKNFANHNNNFNKDNNIEDFKAIDDYLNHKIENVESYIPKYDCSHPLTKRFYN